MQAFFVAKLLIFLIEGRFHRFASTRLCFDQLCEFSDFCIEMNQSFGTGGGICIAIQCCLDQSLIKTQRRGRTIARISSDDVTSCRDDFISCPGGATDQLFQSGHLCLEILDFRFGSSVRLCGRIKPLLKVCGVIPCEVPCDTHSNGQQSEDCMPDDQAFVVFRCHLESLCPCENVRRK